MVQGSPDRPAQPAPVVFLIDRRRGDLKLMNRARRPPSVIEQIAQRVVLSRSTVQRREDYRLRVQGQPPALAGTGHHLVRHLHG
jgi:hypothetical protein